MSTHDLAVLIERMEQATADARAVIREAHELRKDLRLAAREAKAAIEGGVAERIEAAARDELAQLGEQTRAATNEATAKVAAEFDRLGRLFLYGDNGGEPLETLIRRRRLEYEARVVE